MNVLGSPTAPSSSSNLQYNLSPTTPTRKRKIPNDALPVSDPSPLARKFRKLNIREPTHKITKRKSSPSLSTSFRSSSPWRSTPSNLNLNTSLSVPSIPPPPSSPPPAMEVDETPHKIYIHDLDAELAELTSDSDESIESYPTRGTSTNTASNSHRSSRASKKDKEAPIIFLSDVERQITRIPQAVLNPNGVSSSSSSHFLRPIPTRSSSSGMDLILYQPPEKIVAPQQDELSFAKKLLMERRMQMHGSLDTGGAVINSDVREVKSPTPVNPGAPALSWARNDNNLQAMELNMHTPPMNGFGMVDDPDAMILDDL